jgi:ElaB/YqjD/DUF883 family membrane-anchored ribosome-binding protein
MTEQLKAAGPRSLHEARRAVEQSRERISATLDELEDRIVETKQSIQRKADVVKPAREAIRKAPLIALGVAVAVGIFLGTRGGDDDDVDEDGWEKSERKALEEWRVRRRKMLLEEAEDASEEFEDEEEDREPGPFSRFLRSIAHEVAGVAVGVIGAEIAERMVGARSHDDENEDDDTDGMSPEIASRFDGLHDGDDSEHLYDDEYEDDEFEEDLDEDELE